MLPSRSADATGFRQRTGGYRPNRRTHRIGRKIVQPRRAAGQEDLMPLVQHTDQQSTADGQRQNAPAALAAGQTDRQGEYRKHGGVGQLIPRRRHQAHGDRLSTTDQQRKHDGRRQQHGQHAQPSL